MAAVLCRVPHCPNPVYKRKRTCALHTDKVHTIPVGQVDAMYAAALAAIRREHRSIEPQGLQSSLRNIGGLTPELNTETVIYAKKRLNKMKLTELCTGANLKMCRKKRKNPVK
jgi:hypothetical protein